MPGLFSLYHEHALKLSSLTDRFEFFGGHICWAVRQVGIERDGFELKALCADDVSTFLSLTASRTQPVLVFEKQMFCCSQRSKILLCGHLENIITCSDS